MRCTQLLSLCFVGAATFADFLPARAADVKPDDKIVRTQPKSLSEAAAAFQVLNGFRMEPIAHEPNIASPVAAVYDEDGRLYVVEMRGYPFPEERDEKPTGRVRLLEDKDQDGVYETSHIFVDHLSWPTGICLYRGGVFVTVAPDIWYFKDTNGDHKADIRERRYTGFGRDNVQGLVNSPIWGLDHKIYVASASNGGDVRCTDRPKEKAVSVRGRDIRIDPTTGNFETLAGSAQFGNAFDDWGNRFICSNSEHAMQSVLPARYLQRNPYLAAPTPIAKIAKEGGAAPVFRISPVEAWRLIRTRRRAESGDKRFAASELVPAGFFTSAASVTPYRGGAYPEAMHGNLFVGDVGGNLVHRKTIRQNGGTFLAERADPDTEFVRSTDNWFRPVNFVNAPDGTLHIIDMYRETIEHPKTIPDDLIKQLDMFSGQDMGRIYRLTPPEFRHAPAPRLSAASIAELVALLDHPNSWQRETAHRLLFERQDKSAIEPLRKLAANAKTPIGKAHALWSLEGLGALRDDDLLAALNDPSPRLRQQAVRLSESRLAQSSPLVERVLALAKDEDPHLRMQVAFSLGEAEPDRAFAGLAEIAKRDAADPWIRAAVLSSASTIGDRLAVELMKDADFAGEGVGRELLRQLAFMTGVRNQSAETSRLLAAAGSADSRAASAIFLGLADGLSRSRSSLAKLVGADPKAAELFQAKLQEAAVLAADTNLPVAKRRPAIDLLGFGNFAAARAVLPEILAPSQPSELQSAAVIAMGKFSDPDVVSILLAGWSAHTPTIRDQIIQLLLSRTAWIDPFLNAVEAKQVAAAQVPLVRRELLLKHPDAKIRGRADQLFGKEAPSPRASVIAAYQPALSLAPDVTRGAKVFERECVSCHKAFGKGHEVGPNLATIRNRTPDALMMQILDPNREVQPNFVDYIISVDDGRVLTGLIDAESESSVTLKRASEARDTILRPNIVEMTSTGKSLMPEGLEQKIQPQEMADLLAFLLSLGS